MAPSSQPRPKGQALVELAGVLPLLVAFIFFGLWLTALVHRKLELLQESRLLAWRMAAFPLTGYGVHGDGAAVQRASAQRFISAQRELLGARRDLVAALGAGPFEASVGGLEVSLEDAGVQTRQGPLGTLLQRWGLGERGKVTARLALRVQAPFLPTALRSERLLTLRRAHTVVAESWFLPDGLQSNMVHGRAGKHVDEPGAEHDSLLYRQVKRMTFGGVRPSGAPLPLRALSALPLPSLSGTFVVSHSYIANEDAAAQGGLDRAARGCGAEGAHGAHGALLGLSNLAVEAGGYPGAEAQHLGAVPELRCLDTAPFRETPSLRRGLSNRPIISIFEHRGAQFMGCRNPMADDPSRPQDADSSDESGPKVDCE